MLQIITGRIFGPAECHITDQKAILFSSYHWVRPINLSLGLFEPVADDRIVTWTWSYQHRHPRTPGKFSIVRMGTDDVLDQFRCFAIFALRAYFAFRQVDIEHFCRSGPSSQGDASPPRAYIPRIFDAQYSGSESEERESISLLEKAMKLPRSKYRAVSSALRSFRDALEALDSNVDLAYSILVYALESLAQNFDRFTPSWNFYDRAVREELDQCLEKVDPETAASVRDALLKAAHIKLQARFIAFCTNDVSDDHFTSEAEHVPGALRRSELEQALGNAYSLRSKYVHVLQPIVHQLRHPQISRSDTFRWDNTAYLTVSGLVRLTRHILKQFILRGEVLESEEVNWHRQLPDVIELKMAPQYWISNPTGFSPARAAEYLTEFMSYMLIKAIPEHQMVNMLPLMEKLETVSDTCKNDLLIPLLCLYWAYHESPITDEMRRPNWVEFLEKRSAILDQCHIYTMATRIFVGHELAWPAHVCLEAISKYRKKRWKWIQLPIRVELTVFVAVVEKLCKEGDEKAADALLQESILNAAGIPDVQKLLLESRPAKAHLDLDAILGWPTFRLEEKAHSA